ncbi:MAG: sulfotransferase family protein [Rubrobacteraceae bacterium]
MSDFKKRLKDRIGLGKAESENRDADDQPSGGAEPQQGNKMKELREELRQVRGEFRQANRKLNKQEREISGLRAMLEKRDAGDREAGIPPENIVWVFGSGRTGSSWTTFMMGSLPDHSRWNEPLVGNLFGNLYSKRAEHRQDTSHFILGDHHRRTWMKSIRNFLLEGAAARFPERAADGYLVIKEPHGALGAPLLMEALPESRMIFLVRDPRDVISSKRDAHSPGSWGAVTKSHEKLSDDEIVERIAGTYLRDIKFAKEAYDAHEGRKAFVRYEDLRVDAPGVMRRIYSEIGIPVAEEDLARVVEKYAWENIPEEEKGEGKIRRKAKPGGWSEDLTPEQVKIAEKETAWIFDEFYAEG